MFDAHCHLDLPVFEGGPAAAIARALDAGVEGFVVAGVDQEGWRRQRTLASEHPSISVAYGLHPWSVAALSDASLGLELDALNTALDEGEGVWPVALGELGLDRGRRVAPESYPRQKRAFRLQLAMARERDLPVILHVVKAHGAALDIARADGLPRSGGMVHGFNGSAEVAQEWVRLGLHISFSASILRPNAKRVQAAARTVRSSWLLCETDAPDQGVGLEAGAVNEPARLPQVIEGLARLRGVAPEEIARTSALNARKLFLA